MPTLTERFWSKVNKTEICWLWVGSRNAKGYGKIFAGRRTVAGHPVADYAHRVAWWMMHGAIPSGLSVLHACDTPSCVRDDHLFLGTTFDNIADAVAKGRTCHGERNGRAKLTADQVRRIRSLSGTQRQLADQFGVSLALICQIRQRRIWSHVS